MHKIKSARLNATVGEVQQQRRLLPFTGFLGSSDFPFLILFSILVFSIHNQEIICICTTKRWRARCRLYQSRFLHANLSYSIEALQDLLTSATIFQASYHFGYQILHRSILTNSASIRQHFRLFNLAFENV